MKRVLILACSLVLLGLGGCASVPQGERASNVDSTYIARVEAAARTQGVQVYWVNPPRKR